MARAAGQGRVGIDVGGSAIKAGCIDGAGEVIAETRAPLPEAPGEVAPTIAALVRELGGSASLGIGLPGLLDRERGVITKSPNLPQLEGLDLPTELARELELEREVVRVENDANAAALGEAWLGAARDAADSLTLTLGTGIGGGLILGGELHVGAGLAGEIGHVRIDPSGPRCGCGGRGCLETLASATAARRRAKERGLPEGDAGNLELLNERAAAGPGPEAELLHEVGFDLGIGISTAICLVDVRCYVLGGGFSAALEALRPGIEAGIREGAYGDRVAAISIRRATLGGNAGWIGAARLAHALPPSCDSP